MHLGLFLLVMATTQQRVVFGSSRSIMPASITSSYLLATPNFLAPEHELRKRQTTTFESTCGYLNGNPTLSRTAGPGGDCRVDTSNGLWGFCPTTVISAKDCGLGGFCFDSYSCTSGCGPLPNRPDVTTWYW